MSPRASLLLLGIWHTLPALLIGIVGLIWGAYWRAMPEPLWIAPRAHGFPSTGASPWV